MGKREDGREKRGEEGTVKRKAGKGQAEPTDDQAGGGTGGGRSRTRPPAEKKKGWAGPRLSTQEAGAQPRASKSARRDQKDWIAARRAASSGVAAGCGAAGPGAAGSSGGGGGS